ncbi:MAG: hypothetical protein OXM61_25255 [Candidatus Poribacteria bacterium]|nr:hypothetical protein [Candidatus Poribacteria bacterium]
MRNDKMYAGSIIVGDVELETREVTLSIEEWQMIDELSEKCPSINHKGKPNYLEWVLRLYLWLCKQDWRYVKGVYPTPAKEPPENQE